MKILKYNDGKEYRIKRDVLTLFGIEDGNIMKANYDSPRNSNNMLSFFHMAQENDTGGRKPLFDDDHWLNFPIDDAWSCFVQLQIAGDHVKYDAERRENKYDEKNRALFLLEERDCYRFYGVYKSTMESVNPGVCIFRRIAVTLDTDAWQVPANG
jgi:hypothetical protein